MYTQTPVNKSRYVPNNPNSAHPDTSLQIQSQILWNVSVVNIRAGKSSNLDKYILQLRQIDSLVWTNTSSTFQGHLDQHRFKWGGQKGWLYFIKSLSTKAYSIQQRFISWILLAPTGALVAAASGTFFEIFTHFTGTRASCNFNN